MEQHLDPPFTRHVRFLSLSLHRICPHGEITQMRFVGTPVLDSSVPVRSLFIVVPLCFILFSAVLLDDSFCTATTTTNDRTDSHRPDIATPLFLYTRNDKDTTDLQQLQLIVWTRRVSPSSSPLKAVLYADDAAALRQFIKLF